MAHGKYTRRIRRVHRALAIRQQQFRIQQGFHAPGSQNPHKSVIPAGRALRVHF